MTNVYLVSEPTYPYNEYNWTAQIQEIKNRNPDIILIISLFELEAFDSIYGPFVQKISSWLRQNNKTIEAIVPGIRPNNFNHVHFHHIPGFIIYFYKQYNEYRYKRDLSSRSAINYDDCEHFNNSHLKLFTCYMNNPRYERALLLDNLVKNELVSKGVVTFHVRPTSAIFNNNTTEFYRWQYHDGSRLFDEFDFVLNSQQQYTGDKLPKSFFKAFLDIVCESEYKDDWFFMTEKTLKSISSLKPFLTLASRGHNKEFLVKKYGFKLYDEYFDYSFDDKPLEGRVQGIVDNLKRLSDDIDLNKFTYKDLYRELLPKLFYNQYRVLEIYHDKNLTLPDFIQKNFNDFSFINQPDPQIFLGYTQWIHQKRNI